MDGQSFSSKVKDIEKFWEDSTGLHRHGHLAVLFSNLFGLGKAATTNCYLREGFANLSDPLQSCCSICFTILKFNLALTTPHQTGGVQVMLMNTRTDLHILKVGWQTRRLGGSTTTRFPQRPPLGTQRWGSHSSNFCFGDVWHSDPHFSSWPKEARHSFALESHL